MSDMEIDTYPRLLTRMDMADLRTEVENAQYNLYMKMLDHIGILEDRIRILERRNRELRGANGRQTEVGRL